MEQTYLLVSPPWQYLLTSLPWPILIGWASVLSLTMPAVVSQPVKMVIFVQSTYRCATKRQTGGGTLQLLQLLVRLATAAAQRTVEASLMMFWYFALPSSMKTTALEVPINQRNGQNSERNTRQGLSAFLYPSQRVRSMLQKAYSKMILWLFTSTLCKITMIPPRQWTGLGLDH